MVNHDVGLHRVIGLAIDFTGRAIELTLIA